MKVTRITDKEIIAALDASATVPSAAKVVNLSTVYMYQRIRGCDDCIEALERLRQRKKENFSIKIKIKINTYKKIEQLAQQLDMPVEEALLDAVLIRLNERSPF